MHIADEEGQTKAFVQRALLELTKEKIAFVEMILMCPFVQQIVVEFRQTEDGIRSFDDVVLSKLPR